MGKDTTAFRERFNAYKNGKSVSEIYDAGLPKYQSGKIARTFSGDKNTVPFDNTRRIKLTNAGLATGAILSENLLDEIAEAAYRLGLPIKTAIGLAIKESTLGNPTDDTSVYKILSPEKAAWFKLQGTGSHINNGHALNMQDVVNYHREDNYPEDWNMFDRAFRFYADTPHKYNPGLKNYQLLVDKRANEAWTSPEILNWYKNWEAGKILVNRPEEYKIGTSIQNTIAPKFGKYANGKLPGFQDGTKGWIRANGNDIKFDEETGELVDQITGEKGTIMLPEVTIKPRHYDAYNSIYNPNLIRNFTDWAPVVGDIGQGLDAYNAFKNKDYTTAAILGGLTILPNVAENFGKYTYKGLRQLGVSQDFARDILLNGEAAWKRFKNLDVFDKLRGIKYTDDVYHGSRNVFDIDHARPYSPAGMDSGFHMGSSPTPAYSRANGLEGGALYSGKLKLKEEPFELPDLNRWSYFEITREANKNPQFKKYLEDKGINVDELFRKGGELDHEYLMLDGYQLHDYLKQHNGLPSDKYMADLFKDRNVSFKYKNDFETFNGTPEYSYAIYNPDNVVWKRPFKFSRKQEDLLKLYDIGVAGNYSTDPNHITVDLKNLYTILKDFPKYRLPNYKNGKSPIHIKPANRGKFTALKKRTGHSASWFKENGTPEQKKMAIFALNAKKWKH